MTASYKGVRGGYDDGIAIVATVEVGVVSCNGNGGKPIAKREGLRTYIFDRVADR